MLPPPTAAALAAENQALQAENQQLRAALDTAAANEQNQVRFRTVFHQSSPGQYILAADLTIRQANAAVAALLGLESPLELLGHVISEFAHPDYHADWARLQHALWAEQDPAFIVETCLLRPDGSQVWCRATCVLFSDDAEKLGYTTLEDISERKLLEGQLHQQALALQDVNEQLATFIEELQVANEELLETNATLGRVNGELDTFIYAASHDLRSPISNLQGLVQALVTALPADARRVGMVERILGMMHQSMARFTQTLDRLADFGTAHTPKELSREYVDLAAVLEEVRQELAPLLAATQGQLLVELVGKPTPWFATRLVYSVLFNLISNALKYRHPDRAPVVHVRAYCEPGRLVVRVHDNGLGLSEAQQGQLFRLFKRLHAHVEGLGMGLYLVKKILDSAGGSIQVQSTPGQGSTFTAIFPG